MAPGTGEMPVRRGAFAVEARLIEDVQDLLGPGMDLDRLDWLGDTHGQHTARMEGLPSCGIVAPQVTRPCVPLPLWPCADGLASPVDFVQPGQYIPRSTRMPWGHERGEEKTGRRCRGDARLATQLRWAMTLAFDQRGNGGIVGLDQLTVTALLTVGEPGRWWPEVVMVAQRRGERQRETLTLRRAQGSRVCEAFLGLAA